MVIKKQINKILRAVVNKDEKYWYDSWIIKWGRVEKDIWAVVDGYHCAVCGEIPDGPFYCEEHK